MKAIFGYHYPKQEWFVLELISGCVSKKYATVKAYTEGLSDKSYTEFYEGEIESVTIKPDNKYSVVHAEGFEFPEVLTLEKSIQESIRVLTNFKV